MMVKSRIIKILNFFNLYKSRYLKFCFEYDANQYERYSSIKYTSLDAISTKIRILCHTIEKAFSLSNCRIDFGKEKIENLIILLKQYQDEKNADSNTINLAKSIIFKYACFRTNHNLDISFIPNELKNPQSMVSAGAQLFEYDAILMSKFTEIANARHSVRNYSERPIAQKDIIKAIEVAQTAPSACNRQATRIYACTNAEKIKIMKDFHGGMRAFGNPSVIFAITQNLSAYLNEYERNTWLVDGGIFCMNLLYALLSVGIGSCPVIWGGMKDDDAKMAKLLGIPTNERIVILVVGGYLPAEGCKSPYSSKRPVRDIIRFVD